MISCGERNVFDDNIIWGHIFIFFDKEKQNLKEKKIENVFLKILVCKDKSAAVAIMYVRYNKYDVPPVTIGDV